MKIKRGDTVFPNSATLHHTVCQPSCCQVQRAGGRPETCRNLKSWNSKGAPSLRSLRGQRHSKSQTEKRLLDGSAEVTLSF